MQYVMNFIYNNPHISYEMSMYNEYAVMNKAQNGCTQNNGDFTKM